MQGFFCFYSDFQVIYASGIKRKAGLSPENLADDLGPLFESIMRCIPGPRIDKDGSLQMLVNIWLSYCFLVSYFNYSIDFILYI
jgi:predicted membrane GTPase involved in stress response